MSLTFKNIVITFTSVLSLWVNAYAMDQNIEPTSEIYFEGRPVAFRSTEKKVQFVRPDSWDMLEDKSFVERIDANHYELNIIFRPSYATAERYAREAKLSSNLIFFPLSYRLQTAELQLSEFVGEVETKIVPSQDNQSPFLYFKVRLDNEQLETLKKLARSIVPLTGYVSYSYRVNGESRDTSASLRGKLMPYDLLPVSRIHFGLEWFQSQTFGDSKFK